MANSDNRIYKAPDAASARDFLESNPVTKEFHYLVVETPEGNFGRDMQGMYEELDRPAQMWQEMGFGVLGVEGGIKSQSQAVLAAPPMEAWFDPAPPVFKPGKASSSLEPEFPAFSQSSKTGF